MRQVNHLNGSMNMAQTLLAVFIFTLPFAIPLQAADLPPGSPLGEKDERMALAWPMVKECR